MLRFSPNNNLAHLIHWFEWEEEAFRKAREQDRPVMLFLSAFWCRYCQRMDEEAFSDRENMALINAYFVALRVEDAKRPDIDARYNLNGWPTIAFLAPTGELLAAVNYLRTEEFKEVLLNLYLSYQQAPAKTAAPAQSDESQSATAQLADARRSPDSALNEITHTIMALADRVNGGYGRGQKFINAQADDFLLARYEATQDSAYLDHVRLTLDRMREGPIHDVKNGGYFRTTTGADWSQPHREKLLGEQAGLLANCLQVFRITQRPEYASMAEEIIGYLDSKLLDPSSGAFFGCEDFLRRETSASAFTDEFFTIIDNCVYVDGNAIAVIAYLDAAAILNRADCKERALRSLGFLWNRCRSDDSGMYHYFDGAPQLPGLLSDQAQVGMTLVRAYLATQDGKYLDQARALAGFTIAHLKNPGGGYFDVSPSDYGIRKSPLTEISQNGIAALFFLKLAAASGDAQYRGAAQWAFDAFTGDFTAQGIHAARFGRALSEWLGQK
jgi:uncharacterized protein